MRYLYILSYYNQLKILCAVSTDLLFRPRPNKKMMVYTKNRGPDANGIYHDTDLTMSHDRLSIIDLNERSNQPMKFKIILYHLMGRFIIIKN